MQGGTGFPLLPAQDPLCEGNSLGARTAGGAGSSDGVAWLVLSPAPSDGPPHLSCGGLLIWLEIPGKGAGAAAHSQDGGRGAPHCTPESP